MKRELLCTECANKTAKLAAQFGEELRQVKGAAKADFVCDNCNASISKGSAVVASSIVYPGGVQYRPWESAYVRAVEATP